MIRSWIYGKMTGHAPLTAYVGSRIYESSRLQEVPTKPYIMYKMFVIQPEMMGDDVPKVYTQSFQVFVHDVVGDFLRIDEIIGVLKNLFLNASDKAEGVEITRWIDSSEDFKDPDMGTNTRFIRFRVLYKEV
ncbi:MAG: hypothetical protein DMF62_04765 [Acidobacteria bacterium]|nr:MAG: hypothetical protein DMF62_04765 [Acidobacteriota bacterium]